MRYSTRLALLGILTAGLAAQASAGLASSSCSSGASPAATLLVPYFEVDLTSTSGLTTLLAVTNAGAQSTLAHVVVWTDWGVPTLKFDLFLAANDVQSINLRDLFAGHSSADWRRLLRRLHEPVAARSGTRRRSPSCGSSTPASRMPRGTVPAAGGPVPLSPPAS